MCREAGNILVRDLDLCTPDTRDARHLEVVVDGLPLFGGAQFAVNRTLVSAVQGNGEPRNGVAERDGVGEWKEIRTYIELVHRMRAHFVQSLARARARSEPRPIQRRVEQAWRLRWYSILYCCTGTCSSQGAGVGTKKKRHRTKEANGCRDKMNSGQKKH